MVRIVSLVALAMLGCSPGEDIPDFPDTNESGSACPKPTRGISLTITGRVVDGGSPAGGATVRLEDRDARPTAVFGTTTTGNDGRYSLDVTDLVAWPNCWNLITDHYLVAEKGEDSAERSVNRFLSDAVREGETTIAITDRDLDLASE